MTKTVYRLLLALCVVIGAGGFFQVLVSPVFWCGRVEAFPGTTVLGLICIGQTALYLAASASPDWAKPYRLSQVAVLPFLLLGLLQVFAPHPRTAMLLGSLVAIPLTLAFSVRRCRWMRPQLLSVSALFVASTLGFLAAFGEIPLTLPEVVAPTWLIALALVAAAATSLAVICAMRPEIIPARRRLDLSPAPRPRCHPREGGDPGDFGPRFRGDDPKGDRSIFSRLGITSSDGPIADLTRYLPLALLLFPVLRAKLPDIAYDSYMYKTTLPYQMAEWRTGDTAIIDGFMLGTNLQEMLNALLVAITRDYLPALISTISFVLLLFVTPLAFPVSRRFSPAGRAAVAFAAISAFVLTEAGVGQGTSYQEPLQLLFLVLSLIRCPAWPAFLAVAIAVKINAGFIAPLVLLHHVLGYRAFWLSPRRLLIGAVGGAIVLLPQLNRNVIFSGRLLGLNETLAAVTDPPGPNRIMVPGETRYDARVRGGILNNAILSACNMALLAEVCPTKYQGSDNAGFHVFPASRAPLFALLFVAALLVGGSADPTRRVAAFASVPIFLLCYVVLLAFMSEGRYFLPLSFGFPLLLLINPAQAEAVVRSLGTGWQGRVLGVSLGCWLVCSDLIPGTFTNASWICKREILTAAHTLDLRQPETPLQAFLVSDADRYKRVCPPPGLPPVILSEHDKLNSPYLGTQRIFHVYTQQMIARFFAADPARQARAAQAIIAVVSQSPGYAPALLGPAMRDYTPCFHDDKLQVECSIVLAPLGGRCAASLYRPDQSATGSTGSRVP